MVSGHCLRAFYDRPSGGAYPDGAELIPSRYREDICLDAAEVIEPRVGVLTDWLWKREAT